MDKQDFLEKLTLALTGQVLRSVIEENVSYYNQYIADEVRKGKPESQVLEELGDPRLIARSIIEANGGGNEMAGVYEDSDSGEETRYGEARYNDEPYDEARYDAEDPYCGEGRRSFHTFHISGFWFTLIVTIVLLLLLWLVGTIIGGIFMILGPILMPVLIIWMIYWLFKGPRR